MDIIDIITHEKDTRIYTDYNFLKEFSESTEFEPHIDGGHNYSWGIHSVKPLVQRSWDRSVSQAASLAEQCHPYIFEINGENVNMSKVDFRPRLFDGTQWALLDTGAMVSVYPKDFYRDATLNRHVNLEAVNKSKFPTYGTRTRQVKIGRKVYTQDVILADVPTPILGFNFIRKHRLSFDWNRWGDFILYDKRARISTKLKVKSVPENIPLELAKVGQIRTNTHVTDVFKTFQQYSQKQNQQALDKTKPVSIPQQYLNLILKYKAVLKCDFSNKQPKHGVFHTIDTGNNTPCRAKVRPIMPGTPKAI